MHDLTNVLLIVRSLRYLFFFYLSCERNSVGSYIGLNELRRQLFCDRDSVTGTRDEGVPRNICSAVDIQLAERDWR